MTTLLVFSLSLFGAFAQPDNYPIKGQIDRTVQLSAGATVDVKGVEGPLTIETGDVSTAEIHWTREALTQKDYDCETIDITESTSALTITHRTDHSCHVIQARENMRLVLPRSASITADGIEGSVTIGDTEGDLSLGGVEGAVKVERLRSARLRGIEGSVTFSVDQLVRNGLVLDGIEGAVNIAVSDGVNADVKISGVEGPISIPGAVANVRSQNDDDDNDRIREARLGSGGTPISIRGIEGSVTIRRR
ncbi:MAG: hypothetical protein JO053_10935 [Acidobacteria bacterium]|nr:hypothetical protein [Acidobacteriota bacterium]